MVLSTLALSAVVLCAAMGALAPVSPRERKFEALFDGDEIEGRRYALGEGVTGLDAPTAAFLVSQGRLAEVDDKRFAELPGPHAGDTEEETDEQRAEREAREAADAEAARRLEAARAEVEAGRIPDDLIDADKPTDAKDRLIGRDKLVDLAKAANADFAGNATKHELAAAIIAARAAEAGDEKASS